MWIARSFFVAQAVVASSAASAIDPAQAKAYEAVFICYMAGAMAIDDDRSDAKTVALALVSRCRMQRVAYARAVIIAHGSPIPLDRAGRLAGEMEPGEVSKATEAVLMMRAERAKSSGGALSAPRP